MQNQSPVGEYQLGFNDSDANYSVKLPKGLSEEVVRAISKYKNEPQWMLDFRLKAYSVFLAKKMPNWGGDLSHIDFQDIHYFLRASDKSERKWEDVPDDIKRTFDRIGIPEAEKKFLAGVSSQYDSEVVYHNLKGAWEDKGVIFVDTDTAVREYPELVRKYFGTIIPAGDNKFAALNTAVWSGGSFIYVPKGVHVDIPLQAYFRINAANAGQFERTLIIADEGSFVHYVEGCSAPIYTTDSLHSAVVEIVCLAGSRVRYTTIQNWSHNVYNLVTKRAFVYRDATMEWIDGNIGCLAEGSTVTTPEGVTNIEKLDVGNEVLSYDDAEGKLVFKKVIAKRFSGYQPVHTVSVGERKLQTTSNHPFYSYVYDPSATRKLTRYALEYVRADELEKAIVPCSSVDYGSPYRLKLPLLTTQFISKNQYVSEFTGHRARESRLKNVEKTTESLMWLFGYWIGDGDLEVKSGTNSENIRWAKVGFSSPIKDRARNNLVSVMSEVVDGTPTERKDGIHVTWNSKELYEFFVLNGFVGHADTKRVPKWVWSIPEKQRLAFISGYIDADGSIKDQRDFSIKSCNKALLEDIASLLITLGITPRIYTEFSGPKTIMILGYACTAHGAYRLSFPLDIRFESFISSALKQKIAQTTSKKLLHKRLVGRSQILLPQTVEISKVKVSELSNYFVPTWDIEVEGTGNFVSQGFIVHNSKLTMKYPSVYLKEEGARGEVLSLAFAGKGQHQDAGAKAVHLAPNTTSLITSKSICKDGGRTSYRGLLRINKNCYGVKSTVKCDALVLDDHSISDTYPTMQIQEQDVTIGHEASVGKIGEEQLFYLMSRGLSGDQAAAMIVQGFVEPILKELPMEYSVEMNRLIQMDMEGSVG